MGCTLEIHGFPCYADMPITSFTSGLSNYKPFMNFTVTNVKEQSRLSGLFAGNLWKKEVHFFRQKDRFGIVWLLMGKKQQSAAPKLNRGAADCCFVCFPIRGTLACARGGYASSCFTAVADDATWRRRICASTPSITLTMKSPSFSASQMMSI